MFMGVEQRSMSEWLKVHGVDVDVFEICRFHLTVCHNERNVVCNGHLIIIINQT